MNNFKPFDMENPVYQSPEYRENYKQTWLKFAGEYAKRWAADNNRNYNDVMMVAMNYINGVTEKEDGLLYYNLDSSPKRDAYDFFFNNNGEGINDEFDYFLDKAKKKANGSTKITEGALRRIVTESVRKVLKEEINDAEFNEPSDTELLACEIVKFANSVAKGIGYKSMMNPGRNKLYGQDGDAHKAIELALSYIS